MKQILFNLLRLTILLGLILPGGSISAGGQTANKAIRLEPANNDKTNAALSPQDEYSISGRVTDRSGNPIAGVTMTAELTSIPAQKPPIVFVHGWHGGAKFQNTYPFCTMDQVEPDDYFGEVDDYLRDAGYHVEYAYLESSSCWPDKLR